MRLEAALHQRLVQQMRLAPQIIQSIEILQLPLLDLQNLIQQELEENPVLEVEDPGTEADDSAPDGATATAPETSLIDTHPAEPGDLRPAEESARKEFERLAEQADDADYGEYLHGPRPTREDGMERDKKLEAMQNTAARPASLSEYLYDQFCLRDDVDVRTRELGRIIIFNLDDRGFLLYPLEEIFTLTDAPAPAPPAAPAPAVPGGDGTAAMAAPAAPEAAVAEAAAPPGEAVGERPPACRAEVEAALRIVQQLEPRGVGARTLQECLLLQLDLTDPDCTLKQILLTRHLDDVLKNRIPKIAREVNLPIDEITRVVEGIKHLTVRPGSEYSPENSPYIRPDVLVDPDAGGGYTVSLEDDYLPPLRINGHYRRLLREAKQQPELRAFLQKKIESARWLIDSIEQRRSTLLRVANEIVRRQRAFLDHGISHHRPLKMQEVADTLGIHVSTVSRAISGKHAQTHRGIYALKFFFAGGTDQSDGEQASRAAVKDKVEAMIKIEDPKLPLSDDEIADKLKTEGLAIARRTVTKYRKMLGIPSSRQRKVF